MNLIHNLFGNATEAKVEKVQAEFQAILIDKEEVVKAFKLFRDLLIVTNFRLIAIDKQGVTGSKQNIHSIPWKSVKTFSCETVGLFEGDSELHVSVAGEAAPLKYELGRSVDVREVYRYFSYYVLSA